VNTPGEDRLEQIYRVLVLLNIAVLLAALVVGLAAAHRTPRDGDQEHGSTFERPAPHLDNWPTHYRPTQRG
jgi:hypothetical protein